VPGIRTAPSANRPWVYLGNLPNKWIEAVRVLVSKYGVVHEITLSNDRHACVHFANMKSVSRFMLDQPFHINGRQLTVNRAAI
jgi:hypothetical protein